MFISVEQAANMLGMDRRSLAAILHEKRPSHKKPDTVVGIILDSLTVRKEPNRFQYRKQHRIQLDYDEVVALQAKLKKHRESKAKLPH